MVYGCHLSVLMLRGLVDRDRWWRHPHCLNHVQTASKFCLHQWGLKPTLLDQCNSSNLKALILAH
jgi:hypothetical protein